MSQLGKIAIYADHVQFMLEESPTCLNPELGYIIPKHIYDTICYMLSDITHMATDDLNEITSRKL